MNLQNTTMTNTFKQCLWRNFGAAIDMLKSAVTMCPDELWQGEPKFFYMAYHTAIFLDYYLSQPVGVFRPALPYTLVDVDKLPDGAIDDVIPDRWYSREEILAYLSACREKCRTVILTAGEEELGARWIKQDEIAMHGLCPSIVENYTLLEILFYNLRHVQHHLAQLNFMLRQKTGDAPPWVSLVD